MTGAMCLLNGAEPAQAAMMPDQLSVIVNTNDAQSVALAEYYRSKRKIPVANIIHVSLPANATSISEAEFNKVKQQVDSLTPGAVQAYALTWLKPYRVECMSITTAFAVGFNRDFCAEGCKATRSVGYFDSASQQPAVDFGLRPTMSIAARTLAQAKALVDRGVASDGTAPHGTAYLISTADKSRNVRAVRYGVAQTTLSADIDIKRIESDALRDAADVMFYFTGSAKVPDIQTNHFLPGAVADHLTSAGGDLLGEGQMSILKWTEAGATGSYGTVVEPCNFLTKFPDPVVMMRHYLAGETLIEAYWKSVAMPGQGIFIGEPLARPYYKESAVPARPMKTGSRQL
jgi:uncharacterized protein (TIGR03790 family)